MSREPLHDLLKAGRDKWNSWRKANPDERPNLTKLDLHNTTVEFQSEGNGRSRPIFRSNGALTNFSGFDFKDLDMREANLMAVDLEGADLRNCNLDGANLFMANLSAARLEGSSAKRANLSYATLDAACMNGANFEAATLDFAKARKATFDNARFYSASFEHANLSDISAQHAVLNNANFSNADLSGAILRFSRAVMANFVDANLCGADLTEAMLFNSSFIRTNLTSATLARCHVYGVSVWEVVTEDCIQHDLRINLLSQPEITVDNLALAQFVGLLINNNNIRNAVDTITSKVVLILGRFTHEDNNSNLDSLQSLRETLRSQNLVPVVFDFPKPGSRDFTETVSTLAHLSLFVVADISSARSVPQELNRIIPQLPSVSVQPIRRRTQASYAMFSDLQRYPWVKPLIIYENQDEIITGLRQNQLLN